MVVMKQWTQKQKMNRKSGSRSSCFCMLHLICIWLELHTYTWIQQRFSIVLECINKPVVAELKAIPLDFHIHVGRIAYPNIAVLMEHNATEWDEYRNSGPRNIMIIYHSRCNNERNSFLSRVSLYGVLLYTRHCLLQPSNADCCV